ncbi:MAG: signal peptide peptidase SppA [Phycisphaerales bacterium]
MRRSAICPAIALLATLAALPGCLPSRVTIDLQERNTDLQSTTVLADPGVTDKGAAIALIDLTGVISSAPGGGIIGGAPSTLDTIIARLRAAERDGARAVLLRINSPGGTVAASETLADEIADFRRRTSIPVVASIADVGASGGYYVALACDAIYCQPSSITGSVGVIVQTFNVSGAMQRWGVQGRAVTSKPNKDIANPFEPPVEDHYAILQGLVDGFYDDFRTRVRGARPTLADDPDDFALATDGRVFTGRQAFELGLVDGLGTLRDAFDEAKRRAGLPAARLIKYHADGNPPASPYSLAGTPDASAQAHPLVQIHIDGAALATPGFYYLWAPGVVAP